MTLNIDIEYIKEEDIIPELFYLFYEEEKEELEREFFSQEITENFTHFCVKKWREFDHALYGE